MSTEVETEPKLGEAPPCWPPVAHMIHKKDEPVREGSIALCGVKLMGLDLGRLKNHTGDICPKCVEVFLRLARE